MKYFQFIKDNPTLALTLASAYIYLCTYKYETGFLNEFNISETYLSFDINIILKDSIHIIFIVFTIICFNEGLVMLFAKLMRRSTEHRRLINFLIKLVLLAAVVAAYGAFPARYALYLVGGILGLYLLLFLRIALQMLFEKIQKKEYLAKPISTENNSSKIGSDTYNIAYSLILPFILCQTFGAGEAYHQTKFEVINDSVRYVVIRKYGDEMICKEITKNNSLGVTTKIYKLSDLHPFTVAEQELGNISTSYVTLNKK